MSRSLFLFSILIVLPFIGFISISGSYENQGQWSMVGQNVEGTGRSSIYCFGQKQFSLEWERTYELPYLLGEFDTNLSAEWYPRGVMVDKFGYVYVHGTNTAVDAVYAIPVSSHNLAEGTDSRTQFQHILLP